MSTFAIAFKEHVQKISRKEIRQQTKILRRASAQFRRDIASLKRALGTKASRVLRKFSRFKVQELEGTRFSARSVRVQRARLGISAADFGRLVGVSPLTIYHWEAGKAKPRTRQFASFLAIRGLDKQAAFDRLGLKPGELGRRGRRRGRKPKVT